MFPVMITGHRVHKSYAENKDDIVAQIDTEFHELMDVYGDNIILITGMALGPDQWFAELGLKYGLTVHAYIPFVGQEKSWTRMEQASYRTTLEEVEKVIVVSNIRNSNVYIERNIEMLKAAKHCIAIYDKSRSGTGYVVNNTSKYSVSLKLIDLEEYK